MNIKNNINKIVQNLPPGCRLVAVSKTQPVEKIREAYDAGQRVFGENKAQELAQKRLMLPDDIEWHMIGHLQRNKIKYIAPFVHLIHGVDSLKLLEEINRQGAKVNRVIAVLLQVHIAEEASKFGFDPEELTALMKDPVFSSLDHVAVKGLMGMATFTPDRDKIRREFDRLRALFVTLQNQQLPSGVVMEELSMGMSGDYDLAVRAGSTLVRVGTAIFGERNTNNET